MPSIQSKLFTRFAGRGMGKIFGDFDVERLRRTFERMEKVVPHPRGVDIEPQEMSHCDAEWIRPRTETDRVVLYFPGGAWVLRSPAAHRRIVAKLAKAANVNALLVFYSLAPEHPFPAGLNDCLEAYEKLMASGIHPSQIVIGGDSAGGNLCLALLLLLRDRFLPLPAGAFALSPCTDMSMKKTDPQFLSSTEDPMFPQPPEGVTTDPRRVYVAGNDEQLDHPYCSPLRGDLRGLCPLLLQVGSTERLLNDSTAFVEKARSAGVQAEVEIWEGQPHVWHGMPFPETEQAIGHLGDFIRLCCP